MLERAFDGVEAHFAAIIAKAQFWHRHRSRTLKERQRLMLNTLLDGFEGKRTSTKWAKITKSSPDTALRDIDDLIEMSILQRDKGGGRSTSYSLVDLGQDRAAS